VDLSVARFHFIVVNINFHHSLPLPFHLVYDSTLLDRCQILKVHSAIPSEIRGILLEDLLQKIRGVRILLLSSRLKFQGKNSAVVKQNTSFMFCLKTSWAVLRPSLHGVTIFNKIFLSHTGVEQCLLH